MQLKLGIVLKSKGRIGDFGKPKAGIYRDFDPFFFAKPVGRETKQVSPMAMTPPSSSPSINAL